MVGQNVALHPHILSSVSCVVTAMKYTALLKQHTAGSNAATHSLGQYASLNKKNFKGSSYLVYTITPLPQMIQQKLTIQNLGQNLETELM
jgi:hypothetical protein